MDETGAELQQLLEVCACQSGSVACHDKGLAWAGGFFAKNDLLLLHWCFWWLI